MGDQPSAGIIPPQVKKLRTYNTIMGFFHLAQAVVIYLMSNDFTQPVTTAFLKYSPETERLFSDTQVAANLPLGSLVALFLLLSAIAHFIIVLPGVFNWYAINIQKGINYARWYEYSLSASLMIVLIMMLSGIYDMVSLIMAFTLTAVMNLCGLMMEIFNQSTEKTKWTPYVIGCIAGVIPWAGVVIYFFGALSNAEESIPSFVYVIIPTIFALFFSFALNMFLQYKKVGPWRDYLFGERMYVLLSLVAKSALAWQIFGGTLRDV